MWIGMIQNSVIASVGDGMKGTLYRNFNITSNVLLIKIG